MRKTFTFLSQHPLFQNGITGVILFSAALMGVETNAALMSAHKPVFLALNALIQVVFVLELIVRLGAHWPKLGSFFRDGWNVFDFLVVAVSLLPAAGAMTTVVRLARVLRVLRLVSVSPELRLIVETMLRSIPSLGNVAVLLGLLLYVYSILGYHQFHKIDPEHWGDLGRSLQSTFQLLTLEGWVEMQRAVTGRYPIAVLFFSSYIVIAVFVVVNLFIAVVLNNLESAKAEVLAEKRALDGGLPQQGLRDTIAELRLRLDELERKL